MQGLDTDRVKLDARSYRVSCAECGNDFEASRSDASFCSSRCRVAYSRRPAKLDSTISMIDMYGRSLQSFVVRYRRNQRVYNAMVRLGRIVQNCIDSFELENVPTIDEK